MSDRVSRPHLATSVDEKCSVKAPRLNEKEAKRLADILAKVERDLEENVMPFWSRSTWDESYAGFITHLDRMGERTGVSDKYLVMQARMIWGLSAAHRFGLRDKGYLELASRGVNFLSDTMWDGEHGGFFWSVRRNGKPKDPRKRIVGHAYVIYALAEYFLASSDSTALALAEDTFELIRQRAEDRSYGFLQNFTREWKLEGGSWRHPRGWLHREAATDKRMDTHMHLMEALTVLAQATRKTEHVVALQKVTDLLLSNAIPAGYGCAIEHFHRDWQPRLSERISFGHNVELAWLLLDAAVTLSVPLELISRKVLGLVDHALAFGFDAERGGLARYGRLIRRGVENSDPPSWLVRVWWVQAEMLVALLEAFQLTYDRKYLDAFERQFAWVWNFQIDHEAGDWYELTDWPDGEPLSLNKGHEWKTLYHNSRALMRVSRTLREWNVTGSTSPRARDQNAVL